MSTANDETSRSVEEWDLVEKSLKGAWVVAPVAARLGALHQSMAQFPNIKPEPGVHRLHVTPERVHPG